MNSEHMVAGLGENKRQDFTINNIQGRELIMTEFECGTWFLGISEDVKVAGMITESRTGVMGHNRFLGWLSSLRFHFNYKCLLYDLHHRFYTRKRTLTSLLS